MATDKRRTPPRKRSEPSDNGHNEATNHYRLNEVERRLSTAERDVKAMQEILTRIETKIENVATKEYVWRWLAGTILVLFLTLGFHIILRYLSSP